MGSTSNDWWLYKRKEGRFRYGRRPCEDGKRDGNEVAAKQATRKTARIHQKLAEAREDSSLETSEHGPANTVISDF